MKILQNRYLPAIMVMAVMVCVWPQTIVAEDNDKDGTISFEQLPPAVRETLIRESAGGTIGKVLKEIKREGIIYESVLTLDGLGYRVTIYADGVLIEKELQEKEKYIRRKNSKKQTDSNAMSFEKNETGSFPKGWRVAETRGKGKTATWKVISGGCDSKKAIAITENKNSGSTYNLLIAKGTNYKDLEIELNIKSMTGKQDQGGGPIWRVKDANNYYVARWNPLENNFRLYYVKKGRRVQLASADIKTDPSEWHEIDIEQFGNKITAKFDDQKVIEIEDSTFSEGGMVGLWTKADAATAFDDFNVKGDTGGNKEGKVGDGKEK